MKKIVVLVGMFAVIVSAGSKVNLYSTKGFQSWGLKPSCITSDTIGPINMMQFKNFSMSFAYDKLDHKDTAIVDSGVTVNLYGSCDRQKNNMVAISTADSTLEPFGSDPITTRSRNISKGLSLDVKPFYWIVINRTDTDADTLDFKNASGVADSTVMTFDLYTDYSR